MLDMQIGMQIMGSMPQKKLLSTADTNGLPASKNRDKVYVARDWCPAMGSENTFVTQVINWAVWTSNREQV